MEKYIRAANESQFDDINKLVETYQPDSTDIIKFSYHCDNDTLELYADANHSNHSYDADESSDFEAIDALEQWVTSIANALKGTNGYKALAEYLVESIRSDWYSGMSLYGGNNPHTYRGFTYTIHLGNYF